MEKDKKLVKVNQSIFKEVLNRIKNFFVKNNKNEVEPTNFDNLNLENNYYKEEKDKKNKFLNDIKVQEDMGIISLKIKLENNEIKAIDLTDEQTDKLQKIYDKEILEKENKIKKLKRNT